MAGSSDKIDAPLDREEGDETLSISNARSQDPKIGSDLPTIGTNESPDQPSDQPIIAGYRVIDEIGRGGMGVVYKAHDSKLNRVVALKMILAGNLASADDITRFQREAEAAARLDHSGIVPIYEVGQASDNHYFSMKYVEGTPLSQHEELRGDLRSAIGLLLQVARAIQHAHERGILHRDLKPSNILVDATGQPLVTDFGLAKQLDSDSDMTRTGAAMGTPGFMAPEQAMGRRDITTAADIFSLGAILFWMQTGQTPFKGETAMQKLVSTLEDEIPSVRGVIARADSGLDLICQKAMNREPAQRYNSVASFADDLQAWLDGEPLSVRPPSVLALAKRWARNNLRTILGSTLSGVICGAIVGVIFNLAYWSNVLAYERDLQVMDGKSSWLSNLLWFNQLSEETVRMLPISAPLVVAVCALVTVLFVRPSTREANIVSSATAGLAALGFALLVGIGWAPMANESVEKGDTDINFLASTMWMGADEHGLAQVIIQERYPGLKEISETKRGTYLAAKIKHDQTKGILPGMWLIALIGMLVAALPLATSCLLSGKLWQTGERGTRWFLLTLEQALYCLLAFSTVALTLNEVSPMWYWVIFCVASISVALWCAISRKRWYWRVSLLLLVLFSVGTVRANQVDLLSATYRAGFARTDDQLRKQLEYSDLSLAQKDDGLARFRTAIGWLYVGDEEKYVEHCQYMHNNHQPGSAIGFAEQLAKVSLLRPDLHSAEQLRTAHEMAERASAFDSTDDMYWLYMTRGLSEQRKGNPKAAHHWNKRARDATEHIHYMDACSHAIDAIAHLDLGDAVAANESLRLGHDAVETTLKRVARKGGRDVGWVDRLIFLLLERELKSHPNYESDDDPKPAHQTS